MTLAPHGLDDVLRLRTGDERSDITSSLGVAGTKSIYERQESDRGTCERVRRHRFAALSTALARMDKEGRKTVPRLSGCNGPFRRKSQHPVHGPEHTAMPDFQKI